MKRRWLSFVLGGIFIVGAALVAASQLLQVGPGWDASTPIGAGDFIAGPYRAGTEASKVQEPTAARSESDSGQIFELGGVTLRFTGAPARLTGADIRSAGWAGPRGLRVDGTMEDIYGAIPAVIDENEEPPEDFVLLYAGGIGPGGLPQEPYGVILPSGEALLVRLAARTESGGFAICDIYVDPDTDLIQRIRWDIAAADGLWEELVI